MLHLFMKGVKMPTNKPRLNVVLDRPVYGSIRKLADRDGISMSLKARDLIREALKLYEDDYWLEKAEERDKTFNIKKAKHHKEIWG